jgi:hypothetical protein
MPESDKKGRKRTPSFRIEISGNDDQKHDILEKLASVRSELARKHNKPNVYSLMERCHCK